VNYVMRQGKLIEVATIETVVGRRKARRQEPFAVVPLAWAASAAKATRTRKALVWIQLLHTAWRTRRADPTSHKRATAPAGGRRVIAVSVRGARLTARRAESWSSSDHRGDADMP
jgi:hypothetical protein